MTFGSCIYKKSEYIHTSMCLKKGQEALLYARNTCIWYKCAYVLRFLTDSLTFDVIHVNNN